jgi:hypothetical protein
VSNPRRPAEPTPLPEHPTREQIQRRIDELRQQMQRQAHIDEQGRIVFSPRAQQINDELDQLVLAWYRADAYVLDAPDLAEAAESPAAYSAEPGTDRPEAKNDVEKLE